MLESVHRKVEQLKAEIDAALACLRSVDLPPDLQSLRHLAAPEGTEADVLLEKFSCKTQKYRKIPSDAKESCWDPATGECRVVVKYKCKEADAVITERNSQCAVQGSRGSVPKQLHDLLVALDAAEREPRFREFVGIKPFRDQFLLQRGYGWAAAPSARHEALSEAIRQGIILRSSVSNPKSPAYPTTAIKLNREHPVVKSILDKTAEERSVFKPIPIRGEAISSTIFAERR